MPDQEIIVLLDGHPVARLPLSVVGRFETLAIPFCLPRGTHDIELRYRCTQEMHGHVVSALFRALCVLHDYSRAAQFMYERQHGFVVGQPTEDRPAAPTGPQSLMRRMRSLARRGLNKIKRMILPQQPGRAA